MSKALKIRLTILLTLFFATMTIGIDYMLASRWRALLDGQPNKFEVTLEADMCGALTGQGFYAPRYFLGRTFREYKVSYRLVAGRCQRGQKATVVVSLEQGAPPAR